MLKALTKHKNLVMQSLRLFYCVLITKEVCNTFENKNYLLKARNRPIEYIFFKNRTHSEHKLNDDLMFGHKFVSHPKH